MPIQILGKEGAWLCNGLVLPCRSFLAAFLHTLAITHLLCFFTSHVHNAQSVAVVYGDPLMVFMPCIVWQPQKRNMIEVSWEKKPAAMELLRWQWEQILSALWGERCSALSSPTLPQPWDSNLELQGQALPHHPLPYRYTLYLAVWNTRQGNFS